MKTWSGQERVYDSLDVKGNIRHQGVCSFSSIVMTHSMTSHAQHLPDHQTTQSISTHTYPTLINTVVCTRISPH